MLDTEPTGAGPTDADQTDTTTTATGGAPRRRRRAASRPAGPPSPGSTEVGSTDEPAPAAKKTTRKRATKKTTAAPAEPAADTSASADQASSDHDATSEHPATDAPSAEPAPAKKTTRKRATKKSAATAEAEPAEAAADASSATSVLFQPPESSTPAPRRRRTTAPTAVPEPTDEPLESTDATEDIEEAAAEGDETPDEGTARRRRRGGRGRRGRGRGQSPDDTESSDDAAEDTDATDDAEQTTAAAEAEGEAGEGDAGEGTGTTRRRRRRRRRGGAEDSGDDAVVDDPPNTVVRVREPRKSTRSRTAERGGERDRGDREDDDGVRSIKGSTRLEAKKQRRREGRDAGRRRPSVITEAEFLARREAVDRVMLVRQAGDRTQIAVLEDGVLVEHYVSTASSSGLVGNVYLGKVQNVLPSMEAAFVDVGKGRNAVLYAGEVNWDAAGLDGQPRRIELALKSGDPVLVQVTKDPIGHKGARLTSQVSLAGRYLVLVPGGSMTGISRKLPDTERSRLKTILRKVVPEGAGVIVRTAAEGASEEELSRDVARLTAQWEDIEKKSQKGSAAPTLLYGEPDMTIRVVRDIFNEDFAKLIVSGDDAWDMLEAYVGHVAPDLRDRMSRWTAETDVFAEHRIDEQLAKALDRKVWLPSGGYLVIDRTEAMVVVDVNTGKFTGAGGNLEETVTKNNLEAAEEIVRQLRLRDLGGIIVIDFIDMVLESNRDLVLRRLLECLGRDRTKHQVAEVTSLGLVQMTRKRVGQGLHEVFAETCEACNGRGYHIHTEPVEKSSGGGNGGGSDRKSGRGGGRSRGGDKADKPEKPAKPEKAAKADQADNTEQPVPAAEPIAVEDPVEAPAANEVTEVTEPSEAAASAPKAPRRRRKAVSPVTTL
ncbi:MAG: ribonuclease [Actinomycetota bacterium]|nr:ribonuclease [Actinomycetota bacterium]